MKSSTIERDKTRILYQVVQENKDDFSKEDKSGKDNKSGNDDEHTDIVQNKQLLMKQEFQIQTILKELQKHTSNLNQEMFCQEITFVNDDQLNQQSSDPLLKEKTKYEVPAAPRLRARESPIELTNFINPSLPSSKEFMKQS